MLEHQKRVVAAKEIKRKREAEDLSTKLSQLSITISREAGEGEKIFGSVTNKDVSDALRREGYVIDRHDITMEEPIKQLGIFDIPVKLHTEVTATVKVWVVKK
jgi:large subunit ribosomal protein L9